MKEPNFKNVSALPPEQADIRRQQEVKKSIEGAVPEWLRSGKLIEGELVDGDVVKITHGLKRIPKGWFMGSVHGDADVVNVIHTTADAKTISMANRGATGTLSFTLWVY